MFEGMRCGVAVIGWFFVLKTVGAMGEVDHFAQIGPFGNEQQCNEWREKLTPSKAARAFSCWYYGGDEKPKPKREGE